MNRNPTRGGAYVVEPDGSLRDTRTPTAPLTPPAALRATARPKPTKPARKPNKPKRK